MSLCTIINYRVLALICVVDHHSSAIGSEMAVFLVGLCRCNVCSYRCDTTVIKVSNNSHTRVNCIFRRPQELLSFPNRLHYSDDPPRKLKLRPCSLWWYTVTCAMTWCDASLYEGGLCPFIGQKVAICNVLFFLIRLKPVYLSKILSIQNAQAF